MHIVFIIRRFYPLLLGGTEIRMKQIAEALMSRGHRFTVLTRRLDPDLPEHDLVSGIEIYRFSPIKIFFRLAVKKWLAQRHESIDLIHTFRFDKVGILGAWCRRKYGIPHIADIITNEAKKMIQSKKRSKHHEFRKIVAGSDFIHCLNQNTVKLLSANGVAKEKLWYRPNGVDTDLFHPLDFTAGAEEQKVTFLFCGRLEKQKGTDVLLAAWKMLPEDLRSVARLVLVGKGEWEELLRRQTQGYPGIIFAGGAKREEMPEYYRQAQVYVHPSRFEGMSNSILEALASGLPIITTEVDGNSDLVRPGSNGFLVPGGNPAELAKAMIHLIQYSELRRNMGGNSRELAEAEFSMGVLYDEYDKTYRKLAGRQDMSRV